MPMVSWSRRQLVRITYKFDWKVGVMSPGSSATIAWRPSWRWGYRVRSHRGTQFRQWATARLSEYLVKGFTMDDERLKNPPGPGQKDYFDELQERIRDIRSSERRFYQKVLDSWTEFSSLSLLT